MIGLHRSLNDELSRHQDALVAEPAAGLTCAGVEVTRGNETAAAGG